MPKPDNIKGFEDSLVENASDMVFQKVLLQVMTGKEQDFDDMEIAELTQLQQPFLTQLNPQQEIEFQAVAKKIGHSNSPLEFYDGRGLFLSLGGISPDKAGHSSSDFKLFGNSRTFVDEFDEAGALGDDKGLFKEGTFDTRTGKSAFSTFAPIVGERFLKN